MIAPSGWPFDRPRSNAGPYAGAVALQLSQRGASRVCFSGHIFPKHGPFCLVANTMEMLSTASESAPLNAVTQITTCDVIEQQVSERMDVAIKCVAEDGNDIRDRGTGPRIFLEHGMFR